MNYFRLALFIVENQETVVDGINLDERETSEETIAFLWNQIQILKLYSCRGVFFKLQTRLAYLKSLLTFLFIWLIHMSSKGGEYLILPKPKHCCEVSWVNDVSCFEGIVSKKVFSKIIHQEDQSCSVTANYQVHFILTYQYYECGG